MNEATVPGLVAWWTLNTSSGTNVPDVGGYNYTGDIYGTVNLSNGVAGRSYYFTGPASSVVKTTFTNMNFAGGAGTVCWWMYAMTNHTGGIRRILGQEYDPVPSQCLAQVVPPNWYAGWLYSGTERRVVVTASTSNWRTNEWHFYSFVWSTNTVFYMDCVPLGTNANAVSPTNFGQRFYIGGLNASGNPYFEGLIDDVRIYNRRLELSELTNVWNSGYSSQH